MGFINGLRRRGKMETDDNFKSRASTLKRSVFQFHSYEFEYGHHQTCIRLQLPSHEAKRQRETW